MAEEDDKIKSASKKIEEEKSKVECPRCMKTVNPPLKSVDAGMRLRLGKEGLSDIPNEACSECFNEFDKMVSKGAKLRAEQVAKEKNRHFLWQSRLGVVKQARQLMKQKAYSEAALSYEKYIKILEIVCKVPHGTLSPEHLQGQAQELNLIASVLWDLLKIYDKSSSHAQRAYEAADKLTEFARYSNSYAILIRNAEAELKRARYPEAYKRFLKKTRADRPRCFISTAAFEGQRTETVVLLCLFRDHILRTHPAGKKFIYFYYRYSPRIAKWLDTKPLCKKIIARSLKRAALALNKRFHLKEL